jgi:hypothetical protein
MRRRDILRVVLFTTGVLTMAATSEVDAGQDKKDEPKKAENEAVTVRQWIASDKIFLKPRDRLALRGEVKGVPVWRFSQGDRGVVPTVGSEIIDKDGVVWVVTLVVDETATGTGHRCHCEKRESAKKD